MVSRHVSDDEGYNLDNDSTSEGNHTSESHYSTDYEGQYTDHEGSEEEPLPEGIEWWSVHRFLEVNKNLRRATEQALRMRSNVHAIEQLQTMLREMVIDNETINLRSVSRLTSEFDSLRTPRSSSTHISFPESMASSQSIPIRTTNRSPTPIDVSMPIPIDWNGISLTTAITPPLRTSVLLEDQVIRNCNDMYAEHNWIPNVHHHDIISPVPVNSNYMLRNFDTNMREYFRNEQRELDQLAEQTFDEVNCDLNLTPRNFVNIGHVNSSYNITCDKTTSCKCLQCLEKNTGETVWLCDSGASHLVMPRPRSMFFDFFDFAA